MSFRLNTESVTAKNDGGIGIQYASGRPWTLNGQQRGLRTVVSVEVHFHFYHLLISDQTKNSGWWMGPCWTNILWNARPSLSSWILFCQFRWIFGSIAHAEISLTLRHLWFMHDIQLPEYSIVNSPLHIFGISQNMEHNIKIMSTIHREFIFNIRKHIIYVIRYREANFFEF